MKHIITWGDKISKAKFGHKVSDETKRKIGFANKGKLAGDKNPAKRFEVRKKISKSRKGMKFSDEHKKNLSIVHKGKRLSLKTEFKKGHGMNKLQKNPAWKGGKSFEPYTVEFNNQLREEIRLRDRYKCQECGKTQKQELKDERHKLHIHHIDYDKKNSNKSNLISLCNKCHGKTDWNREYWRKKYE